MRGHIRRGAAAGAGVWAAYGIVETFVAGLLPWLNRAAFDLFTRHAAAPHALGVNPGFTLFVLALYPVAGAAIGAAAAALVSGRPAAADADPGGRPASVAGLALVLAFLANGVVQNQVVALPAVVIPFGLAWLPWTAATRPGWRRRVAGLTSLWVLPLILVGSAFILARGAAGLLGRHAVALGYGVAVLLCAWLAGRAIPLVTALQRILGGWRGIAAGMLLVTALALVSAATSRMPVPVAGAPRGDATGRHSAVVLITLDSVRADHLSIYGYRRHTTPLLERLVADGAVLYPHVVASSNETLSAHASIFTGMRPSGHGAHRDSRATTSVSTMSAQVPTLAEVLSGHGYLTLGLAANSAFLDPAYGFARGFAAYDSPWLVSFYSPFRPFLLRQSVRSLAIATARPSSPDALFLSAEAMTDRVRTLLRQSATGNRPLFLFVNYMDAHAPYVPPPPFDRRYPGADRTFHWNAYPDLLAHPETASERWRQHLVSQYDGAIAYLDQQLDALFATLKTSGLFDDALIIVTSDHGEAFGEHGVIGHGVTLYEHQLAVPLIVKYPRGTQPATPKGLVSSADLMPTILDVLGIGIPATVEGESLLRPDAANGRWVNAESYTQVAGRRAGRDADGRTEVALRAGSLKLVQRADGSGEVYDVAADPGERRNLAGTMVLDARWRSALQALLRTPRRRSDSPIEPQQRDILRSLGYVR